MLRSPSMDKQALRASLVKHKRGPSCFEIDDLEKGSLAVVVIGASGDLAKKKTFPALYKLFKAGFLPPNVIIAGFARRAIDHDKFVSDVVAAHIPKDEAQLGRFQKRCFYFQGQYDSAPNFAQLAEELSIRETEAGEGGAANRVFYMAIPPSVFLATGRSIRNGAMSETGWNRVVVEKPFGRDTESALALESDIGMVFTEEQVYRIDHYLGKEMVQNLLALRFANTIYEPLWNSFYIACVVITFKEDFGTQGRGGYFDKFGIIRDVMQNHLTQILALVAMEPPVTLHAEDVRDEKVKLLRAIPPIKLEDVVIGQYGRSEDGKEPAYLDDETVPPGSTAPTYATTVVHINNSRWRGTPFILRAGKALDERKAEIRIQFRLPKHGLFPSAQRDELVLRVQPNEAVYCKMMTKEPGLSSKLVLTELDLSYGDRFKLTRGLPDAYERLILDVVRGDHNLFVRGDELIAAWKIFTPLLHHLESKGVQPSIYPYGSRGPKEADVLLEKSDFIRSKGYHWPGPESDDTAAAL